MVVPLLLMVVPLRERERERERERKRKKEREREREREPDHSLYLPRRLLMVGSTIIILLPVLQKCLL